MAKLVIIDDEPNVLFSLEQTLRSDELEVLTAPTAGAGISLVEKDRPDVVILDVRLPDMSGLAAFDLLRRVDQRLPVIIITAFATTETAIEAMKRGAFEYLIKPLELSQLRDAVRRAIQLRSFRPLPDAVPQNDSGEGLDQMVGNSAVMQSVYKAIGRFASQNVTVLIIGESGTGKELVARALYQHSARANKPMQAINCAAIPESLLESELFGHERGAFTGADKQRIGKFEQCNGGTLFLDEIGDLSSAAQAKVLRLLQDQQFERLGGNQTVRSDVRLIAATNQNLDELVVAGRFRADLLYRLNGFTIRLPALRERRDDIPLLVDQFRRAAARKSGKEVQSITPDVLEILQHHSWPGNVRELQSVVSFGVIHAAGNMITTECLPQYLVAPQQTLADPALRAGAVDVQALTDDLIGAGATDLFRRVMMATERIVLETTLRHTNGNQVRASEILGISRNTLRAKMQALQVNVEKFQS